MEKAMFGARSEKLARGFGSAFLGSGPTGSWKHDFCSQGNCFNVPQGGVQGSQRGGCGLEVSLIGCAVFPVV